jgi:phytol kinase
MLFTGLCVGMEVLARVVRLSPELARKLAHMSAALFAALLPFVLSFAEIAVLALGFAGLMALSLRVGIFTAIHGVSRSTYGEIFFPLGIAALAVACPSPLPFAFGVLVLGICDGLAALVGERYGRRVVPLVQTRKTLWGTGTFLVACFALGVALVLPTGVSVSYALVAAAAMAIALTPVELFLTYGFDNLVLPIVAGSLLAGL